MKLSQVLKAENPLSGKSTGLFDISSIASQILGVIVLFFVVATGQNIAKMISSKVGAFDTTIDPIIKATSTTTSSSEVVL